MGSRAADHARTVLHFDQYDNVFLQLSGRKTFLLFDPEQSGKLYREPRASRASARRDAGLPPRAAAGLHIGLPPPR